jgi:hypothetical protein
MTCPICAPTPGEVELYRWLLQTRITRRKIKRELAFTVEARTEQRIARDLRDLLRAGLVREIPGLGWEWRA